MLMPFDEASRCDFLASQRADFYAFYTNVHLVNERSKAIRSDGETSNVLSYLQMHDGERQALIEF
jgi:hypothetical protein